MPAIALFLAAALAPAAPDPPDGPIATAVPEAWIVKCDVGPAEAPQVRTFRLAPKVFQEWNADQKAFGPNLCLSFACRRDPARVEGRIESRTLIFTLALDPKTGAATWKTVGATGLQRTSGPCDVRVEKAGSAPKG